MTEEEKRQAQIEVAQIGCASASFLIMAIVYFIGLPSPVQKGLVVVVQAALVYLIVAPSVALANIFRDIRYKELRA